MENPLFRDLFLGFTRAVFLFLRLGLESYAEKNFSLSAKRKIILL
ncbi:hypothetical protein HMPREF9441_00321 [Paraprevotella clara YIT 11840]|uniref:Uncharacterized protein n=1 Tax=Paraprevotella clara YIT 11840 TaxID=762968 RepID=G5SLU9_9BACT|nr:hypothetical protein HMPREF9441_00321 [Paraprevotella clara YIT 11840]